MNRLARLCVLPALAFLLAGCFGSWGRPERPTGDAAWISDPAALEGLDLAALQTGGLKELFAEAGTLDWDRAVPHLAIEHLQAVGGPMRLTLVVRGSWQPTLGDSKAAGGRLGDEIKRLILAAQARGLSPAGIHLDLEAGGNLTSYAQGLRSVRGELAKTMLLSASIRRSWLGDEAVGKVARAVDYCVVFVYGQRPGEDDEPSAWDLQEVGKTLKAVEALKSPYMAGIISLGSATHQGAHGEAREWTSTLALGDLVRNPRLKLQGGFTLEGLDRSVYGFRAEAPTTVGTWQVARGEGVRVVGTGPNYLQGLRKRISEIATPRHRGDVYFRLPLAGERLTPSAAQLVDALGPGKAAPDLVLNVELLERNAQHWLFKIVLENRNDEHSDIALLDNNFVEASARGGFLGDVQPGAFQRFELLRQGSDAVDMAALRAPERVRLYLPILEGKGLYSSGPIELRLKERSAELNLSATFLLPDGRVVTPPSLVWTPSAK